MTVIPDLAVWVMVAVAAAAPGVGVLLLVLDGKLKRFAEAEG